MSVQQGVNWRGISRIDYKHTHGWYARVYLRGRRVESKLFSDRKHGGREEALQKAREWRDRRKEELPPKDRPKKIRYRKTPQPRNTSGRVGVSRTFSRGKRDKENKLWCFSVTWAAKPGKPKNRAFYFNTYGSEEAAFKAACEFRAAREREMDGEELTKAEREKYLKSMIDKVMAYIKKAPEHRQERLRQIHALVFSEFPDADIWIKSTYPCYQRGDKWLAFANRKSFISIYFQGPENFTSLFPKHPESLLYKTRVNFKDDMLMNPDSLRKLIRKVLDVPQSDRPDQTALSAPQDQEKKPSKRFRKSPGKRYVRMTKAIRTYIQDTPEEHQEILLDLHELILETCPSIKLSTKYSMPTYERENVWIAVSNQKKHVSLYVKNNDGIAEFAEKHPEIKSGKASLNFTGEVDIPAEDFKVLIEKALQPLPETDSAGQQTEAVNRKSELVNEQAAASKTQQAVPKRKRGRPKKTQVQEAQADSKRKRGRPRKTQQQRGVQAKQMPAEIQAYIDAAPKDRQKRLRSLHNMIVKAYPDVTMSTEFSVPTYERQDTWIGIGNQQQYISVYVKDGVGIDDFVAKHPEIKYGKTCLNLTDGGRLPRNDLKALIQQVFTSPGPQSVRVEETGAVPEAEQKPAVSGSADAAAPKKRKRGRPKKTEAQEAQAAPKRKRGRPKKVQAKEEHMVVAETPKVPQEVEITLKEPTTSETKAAPKRKRGRPKKTEAQTTQTTPKRKRGRPKKVQVQEESPTEQVVVTETVLKETAASEAQAAPKRKRGRPKKTEAQTIQAAPKRKRGRPKKTEAQTIQAAPKRKRGRPKKNQEQENKKAVKVVKKANIATKPKEPKNAARDEERLRQMLESIMAYITQCSAERQQRLFLLHTLILGECPRAQLSMKADMPTYEFAGKRVAIANKRNYISLYVDDRSSLSEFIANHPEIKAGKSCLNFVDGNEVPLLDIRTVIQKALTPENIDEVA